MTQPNVSDINVGDIISRQEAIDGFYEMASDIEHLCTVGDYISFLESLSAQPEIVRCKDCKHYQFADNRAFGMPVKTCKWFGFEDVDDDDFCSRAERRTDG